MFNVQCCSSHHCIIHCMFVSPPLPCKLLAIRQTPSYPSPVDLCLLLNKGRARLTGEASPQPPSHPAALIPCCTGSHIPCLCPLPSVFQAASQPLFLSLPSCHRPSVLGPPSASLPFLLSLRVLGGGWQGCWPSHRAARFVAVPCGNLSPLSAKFLGKVNTLKSHPLFFSFF